MIPAFLITFREVMEASLIVATILGVLIKLNHKQSIKTVWLATLSAAFSAALFLIIASLLGFQAQSLYSGKTQTLIEGSLMIISATFITWAVFFLHRFSTHHKAKVLKKVGQVLQSEEKKGLFILTYIAVLREGLEIVLYLSTIFFSSNPQKIFSGTILGIFGGLIICISLVKFTLRLPIKIAFKTTSILLILFAAGLLARGINEFMDLGLLPQTKVLTLVFIPSATSFTADIIKAIFGITQHMDIVQISAYGIYTAILSWLIFFKKPSVSAD